MKYLLAAVLVLSPAMNAMAASDLNVNLNQVPQPIQDVYNTFSKIHVDVGQNQAIRGFGQNLQETLSNPQNWLPQVRYWWGTFNNWLESTIGVSFREILTVIANLFIWVFELLIKLIKLALPSIQ